MPRGYLTHPAGVPVWVKSGGPDARAAALRGSDRVAEPKVVWCADVGGFQAGVVDVTYATIEAARRAASAWTIAFHNWWIDDKTSLKS
jgi:hypothetical protein